MGRMFGQQEPLQYRGRYAPGVYSPIPGATLPPNPRYVPGVTPTGRFVPPAPPITPGAGAPDVQTQPIPDPGNPNLNPDLNPSPGGF